MTASLTACTSDYSRFYKPVPGLTPQKIAELRTTPPPAVPAIDHTSNPAGVAAILRHGYGVIGISNFTSGHRESDQAAIAQGKEVAADLVLVVDPRYSGTVSGQIPITTPTTNTSVTNETATAYGPRGTATAYGTSTTTTNGSRTDYIPYNINRYQYAAIFFIKRHYSLGANFRDLTDQERQTIQSNSGVYVVTVVDGTPAFNGNILVGDIITGINGQTVPNHEVASQLCKEFSGHTVTIQISRNGKTIEKKVRLLE